MYAVFYTLFANEDANHTTTSLHAIRGCAVNVRLSYLNIALVTSEYTG